MQKYLEKNYVSNTTMENIPKNYRFELEDEYKINLKKEIDRVNLLIQNEKNEAIENNQNLSCKNLIYENKLNIYYYNGDFYNYYRTFLKYKKCCFNLLDKYQNNLENDTVILKNVSTGDTFSKENGYIEFCNGIKKKLDLIEEKLEYSYEKILEDLYESIIHNL
jgi:hypothetical protein